MTKVAEASPAGLVGIDSIREAAAGLKGVAERTPAMPVPALADLAGVPVFLKLENRQPTGAFKLRGAWTAVRRLSPSERAKGVITASSGNHGQAVAFAAQRMGVRAVIVVPETTSSTKIAGIKRWGGEVVLAGTTSDQRFAKAKELQDREGLVMVPPFDHQDVIAGQGTVGLEIVEDVPDVAHVAVPVGGGGQAAGITVAVRALKPRARVHTVEPEGSACYAAAEKAGHPVRLARTASVADGLLPLTVGTLTFAHLHGRAEAITVTEAAIVEATQWLYHELKMAVEPSGAVTTAALRSRALRPTGPTVLVVSGGNVDAATIDKLAPA